jgi:hypothetical protein
MKKLTAPLLFAILATLLLFGAGKCFGQDSTKIKNVLVVECTTQNPWEIMPKRVIFKTHKKIRIETTKDENITARIDFISDSSLVIKGNEIKLRDITKINKYRSKIPAVVGGITAATGIGGMIYFYSNFNNNSFSNYELDNGVLISAAVLFAGLITTLVGLIELGGAKKYNMKENWKFYVKPDIFSQPGMMRFPSKSDTVKGNVMFRPGNSMNIPTPFPVKKKKENDK